MYLPTSLTAERIDVEDSPVAVQELFCQKGWCDGLPIIPPTVEAVLEMLTHSDRPPQEVIALIPPRWGKATVEKIAINAVMAGCRPAYLPVIISAILALVEKPFNLYGIQTTTHLCTPLLIVNGPIAQELELNCRYNVLGQGWRSNATIGRALRLILTNIGGARPGELDRATFGQPAKYSYCLAENEAENPWSPWHVEKGFEPWVSTVTVVGAEGPHNVQDHDSSGGEGILQSVAGTMAQVGSNSIHFAGESVVVLGPEHAATIARDGFSKEQIKAYLFDRAKVPLRRFSPENIRWFRQTWPDRYGTEDDGKDEFLVPAVGSPEQIILLVAGGPGKHSLYIPTFGDTRAIIRAITTKDGRPISSVQELRHNL